MADVIPFGKRETPKPEDKGPGSSFKGELVCAGCKHRWEEEVSIPVAGDPPPELLVCPQCFTKRGRFVWPFGFPKGGVKVWTCNHCGGTVFEIGVFDGTDQKETICVGCGKRSLLIKVFDATPE